MSNHPLILSRPDICGGEAFIVGTRIPVHQLLSMMANGDDWETLMAEYPSLRPEHQEAVLRYAASLAELRLQPSESVVSF